MDRVLQDKLQAVKLYVVGAAREWLYEEASEYGEELTEVLELIFGPEPAVDRQLLADVRQHIVDKVIVWSRDTERCDTVNDALTAIFGVAPHGDGFWRNTGGITCDGFDLEGFNANGYNRHGFNAEGFNSRGYDKNWRDRDGFSERYPFHNQAGQTREQWLGSRSPEAVKALVRDWEPGYRAQVLAALQQQ
jgi:hypothetical protein